MEVIDTLNELLHEDPVLYLSEFDGKFALDARSDLFWRIVLEGLYERELPEIAAKSVDRERDVIDIGANVGFYSVKLSRVMGKGRMFAIEPTVNASQRLRRNVELNDLSGKVEIIQKIISDKGGALKINTIEGKEEYSSIGMMTHPQTMGKELHVETVKSVTLDTLVEERSINPGFIKIDVEGAEHLVFRGAENVLHKHRPIILSELSDQLLNANGSSWIEVIRFIESFDYVVVNPLKPATKPKSQAFSDILCYPREQYDKVQSLM
ncbi:MAG: FkbM family methyltransferase [Verrucomicrobiota bacterium]